MLKIPRKLSVDLSIVIAVGLLVICLIGALIMPKLVSVLIEIPDTIGNRNQIDQSGRVLVLCLAYLVLAAVVLADVLMLRLLRRVRAGAVFTDTSVALIRGVSWCCYLLCAAFCGLGFYFQLAFVVAFAALFLGTCLRVVKNVIEEATRIKSENDLTV